MMTLRRRSRAECFVQHVELEVIEAVLLEDSDATLAILRGLRGRLGARVSIDDFGIGYSSLSCLR